MKNLILLVVLAALVACGTNKPPEKIKTTYDPNWESLAKHNEAPNWFQDAKLGIYFHWGVYSVPAFGNEWYPRHMHYDHTAEYKNHVEKYGHPNEFGYHDFVPMFKAEKFDAAEWVDLFEKAGAKFAGPVAEHHDGFSMWDSEITPWNSMDKGPKKDIIGEMKHELDKRGMKLITTFHHARNLQRYTDGDTTSQNMWKRFNASHYPFIEGMPCTSDDPELAMLYGNIPEEKWNEEVWFGKLKEVIDKYQPDIVWFDSWLDRIPEDYREKFCAYYLNEAEKWDKEVVIVRKQDDLPLDVSVDDLEKSRKNKLDDKVWMTDETISKGSWCYTETMSIKPANDVLHVLIDIVSKNGVLLLNVSPKADGTIPANQQEVLLKMGAWLDKYGEAIYATRPWYTFGEGPTKEPEGHFKNHKAFLKVKYTDDDIRYTTKDNVVYASLLGKPKANKEFLLKSFSSENVSKVGEVKNVKLLGSKEKIEWAQNADGLKLQMPASVPNEMVVVLKIETK